MTTAIQPGYDDWIEHLDQTFTLRDAGTDREFRATLAQAQVSSSGPDSFSLIFRTAADVRPDQGCYQVSAGDALSTLVFLVPVGGGPKGVELEAVFNRAVVNPRPKTSRNNEEVE